MEWLYVFDEDFMIVAAVAQTLKPKDPSDAGLRMQMSGIRA